MRIMKYSSNYDLSFNLLIGDLDDGIVTWDIKSVVEGIILITLLKDHLIPFISKFENVSSFRISSQIQNYATLPVSPQRAELNAQKVHVLSPKELTTFINSAEWNLGYLSLNISFCRFL